MEKRVKTQKEFYSLIESDFNGIIKICDTVGRFSIDLITKPIHTKILISNNARIESILGNFKIDSISGNARIGTIADNVKVGYICHNVKINSISDNVKIDYIGYCVKIDHIYDNVVMEINSTKVKIKNVNDSVILLCHKLPVITKKSKNSTVIKIVKNKCSFSLKRFINQYGVEKDGKYIYLYKSVKDDYTDFHTGKIKYTIGTKVTAPDWDSGYKGECGRALHLSPTPFFAQSFKRSNITLKCKVLISDCQTVRNPSMPIKVRCRAVEVIEEVKE